MARVHSLTDEQKLVITFRVEPGCLGPTGAELVDGFCEYAQQAMQTVDADYVVWNIVPRSDKTLPEMECMIVGKKLTLTQADKYLSVFGKTLDEFETHLGEKLAALINSYLGR